MTSRIHWAWLILLGCFLTFLIHYSIRMSYGILMPEMIISLKLSKAQAGLIASFFYLAYTIFSPIQGFLIDRFSARKILVIFCFIQGVSTLLLGKTESFFQACLFYGLVGVGYSGSWIPTVTLVQRWFGARRRGMALGVLSVSYAFGYGSMGILLPPLVALYDWHACWFVLSSLAFALVPLNALLIRTNPRDLNLKPWGDEPTDRIQKEEEPRISYYELLRIKNLWLGGISYFFIAITAYITNIFVVTYATVELRLSFGQATQLASAIAFSGIPGTLLLSLLSDFIGRKKCVILINLSLAASILLLIWVGNHWALLFAMASIFGFFYSAVWPLYGAVAADFFPPGRTGSVLGFWTVFFGIALIVGPALGGFIADYTGTLKWAFFMSAGAGLLSTLFFLPMKKSGPSLE